jgi:iron complex transport system permease protein
MTSALQPAENTGTAVAGHAAGGNALCVLLLLLLLCGGFLGSFALGRYPIAPGELIRVITEHASGSAIPGTLDAIVFRIRMPRICAALLMGASLAAAGATYQGLFRNPMVSPDILGASAGAGFGAAVAILLSLGLTGIQISSFLFGLGAVAITLLVGSMVDRGNRNALLSLVLTGMVIGSLFSSCIAMTKYVADPNEKLPAITFWLMGGLASVGAADLRVAAVPIFLGFAPVLLLRWKLNVLSFGDEEARSMGLDTQRVRFLLILGSTLLTAASVSLGGMVGWVGLVVPHLARMLVGPNYHILLPVSALAGALFLLLVDDVARCAFSVEIPLGILTSLIGAPFFVYLLLKGKKGWL